MAKAVIFDTDGVVEFIQSLNENGIPLAVATSARKPYTSFILDGLDIRKYFNSVITAEDVVKGKPDPEIFLKAAEMGVIGITTTHSAEELGIADRIIISFREITPQDIEGM